MGLLHLVEIKKIENMSKVKIEVIGKRRNDFIELLEKYNLEYDVQDYSIVSKLEKIGCVTYYPKSDKIQIHKGNDWEVNGYLFVENYLRDFLIKTTTIITELSLEDIEYYENFLLRKLTDRELKIAVILKNSGYLLTENDFKN